jgi:hypothetical protein
MKNLILITASLVLFYVSTLAQMKMGSNPSSLQSGQLLHLETNGNRAGLKIAEVALTSATDATTVALTSPADAAVGTMVWNTSTAGTAPQNVTPGFYVWTGARWERVLSSSNGNSGSIYDANGSLAGNRTVDMPSSRTLAFTPSGTQVVNQFSVDGSTLSVDALNNRVGIGTTSPSQKLDVRGNVAVSKGHGYIIENVGLIEEGLYDDTYLGINCTNGFEVITGTTPTVRMVLLGNGRVGIGTTVPDQLLSVNGNASKAGGGSWATFSDFRVKKEIKEFNEGLDVILKLNPVTFKYNDKSGYSDTDKEYVGFIAQDVEKVAPYMVSTLDDSENSGIKDKRQFDESALIKILVNAVQDQQAQIEALKSEIKELKK